MKEKLAKRLEELKREFETGQQMLTELETKRTELQQNLLRISGAIQVLGEQLEEGEPEGSNGEETKSEE